MTTTVLASNYKLNIAYQSDNWHSYINIGSYTDEQQDALVGALMEAQVEEFNSLLPEGCYWFPHLGEIHGPTTATLEGIDLDEALKAAADAVAERFEEIETGALGVTLYETNSDLLVIARDGQAWSLHAPAGDYLNGTFTQDAQAWVEGDWEPDEGDGQTPTTITDDLTPVAVWVPGGVRLLVEADRLGGAARIYLHGRGEPDTTA